MNRAQLEHVIRAAGAVADVEELVVVGSQAILGCFPEAPATVLHSMEADVYPKHAPERAILIDGAIGEGSLFQETFGYYAHGVSPETAVLPAGADERLIPIRNENTRDVVGWCLEPHDMAVSKLVAGREKDLTFVRELLVHGLVDANVVQERLATVPAARRGELTAARLARIVDSLA